MSFAYDPESFLVIDLGEAQKEFEKLQEVPKQLLNLDVSERDHDVVEVLTQLKAALQSVADQHEDESMFHEKRIAIESELTKIAESVRSAVTSKDEAEEEAVKSLENKVKEQWAEVAKAKKIEMDTRGRIKQNQHQIAALQRTAETGEGIVLEEEKVVAELVVERAKKYAEQQALVATLKRYRAEEEELVQKVEILTHDRSVYLEKKNQAEEQRAAKNADVRREEERKNRMERENEDMRAQVETLQKLLVEHEVEHATMAKQIQSVEARMGDCNQQLEKARREVNEKTVASTRLGDKVQEHSKKTTGLMMVNAQLGNETKSIQEATEKFKVDANKIKAVREGAIEMIGKVEASMEKAYAEAKEIQTETAALEREMEDLSHKVILTTNKRGSLTRERDVLSKMQVMKEGRIEKTEDLISLMKNNQHILEQEVQGFEAMLERKEKQVRDIERERVILLEDAEAASLKHQAALEEVRLREVAMADLQNQIDEVKLRLKQQKGLYDAVRSDRNLYAKNLVEAQEEIQEMKRTFKMYSHRIIQQKEIIKHKNMELVVYQLKKESIEKAKEVIKEKLEVAKKQVHDADRVVANQRTELKKLADVIAESDRELARQKKERDMVTNERNLLSTQLVRRNHELAEVYEKIKVQHSELDAGRNKYRERVSEAAALSHQLSSLQRELKVLTTSVSGVDALEHETHRLRRQLLREQAKVTALKDELSVPMNVHRWRKLEGSDPDTYATIQRVQNLQRKFLQKCVEVAEHDIMIQEREKVYLELKRVLASQPGPEAAEQLEVYAKVYKQKKAQLKKMDRDLKTAMAKTTEFKYTIDRCVNELADLKKKWIDQKRREAREEVRKADGAEYLPMSTAGGGDGGGEEGSYEPEEAAPSKLEVEAEAEPTATVGADGAEMSFAVALTPSAAPGDADADADADADVDEAHIDAQPDDAVPVERDPPVAEE